MMIFYWTYLYLYIIIHIVRRARFGVALRVTVRFFAWRAWLFFDIWILSRSLFRVDGHLLLLGGLESLRKRRKEFAGGEGPLRAERVGASESLGRDEGAISSDLYHPKNKTGK